MRNLLPHPTLRNLLFTIPGKYRLEATGGQVVEFEIIPDGSRYIRVNPASIISMTRDNGMSVVVAVPTGNFPHFVEDKP